MTRRVSDDERRGRLVARHHLARTTDHVEAAVHAVVAMHSSDPATPFLGAWTRTRDFAVVDLERALYDDRTLWRLHAMRRTLFVVTTDDAPVVLTAASRDVAVAERRRLRSWLWDGLPDADVDAWLAGVEERVLAAVAGDALATRELSERVPELATRITVGSGKWTTEVPLSSRLLVVMAMEGRIVRGRPAGTWRGSQHRWAATASWFDGAPPTVAPDEARAELVRRYLAAFGPATFVDVKWWTGWTVARTRAALADVAAATVELDSGREGLVLPDDARDAAAVVDAVAFLPGLDPTPMGWKDRDWYLGPHADELFDRNGNVGPTVWSGGRIVGGWAQRDAGDVVFRLLEPVADATASAVEAEAARLTTWLDGVVVVPRFRTPLERQLSR